MDHSVAVKSRKHNRSVVADEVRSQADHSCTYMILMVDRNSKSSETWAQNLMMVSEVKSRLGCRLEVD